MSVSHHGDHEKKLTPEFEAMLKRFEDQVEGRTKRAYSQGRILPEDDGDLSFAIVADRKTGTVIIDFEKPVEWIGLKPKDVAALVKLLIQKAREVATEPFSVEF